MIYGVVYDPFVGRDHGRRLVVLQIVRVIPWKSRRVEGSRKYFQKMSDLLDSGLTIPVLTCKTKHNISKWPRKIALEWPNNANNRFPNGRVANLGKAIEEPGVRVSDLDLADERESGDKDREDLFVDVLIFWARLHIYLTLCYTF